MEWSCDHSGFKIYLMNCNYVMKKPSKVILKGREKNLLQTAKLMSLSSAPLLWPCQQKSDDIVSFFMKHLKATSGQKGTSNSHGQFLGGLSLHLNHLIASRMANYDWPFGTLPFRHLAQIWTQGTLRHILGPILVIFEICQFLTIPGPFEYFSENGWSQKI